MVKWKLVLEFILTIFIPLLYLINLLIIFQYPNSIDLPLNIRILGLLIGGIGLIVWMISYINLGTSFGVLPQKQKRTKRGIYNYLKHPMYVGIWSTFLGISFANASWQGLIFVNIIITPLFYFRAYFEDKKLTD